MKLLVVRLSAFGDIIHALPALEDLLARPDVQVHWLVDERYRFVTEVFPSAVHVHAVALKGKHPLRDAMRVVRELRRYHFDAVLDFQGLIKSALLARAANSVVYGLDEQFVRERPAAWLERSVPFAEQERHVVQQNRKVALAPFASSLDDLPVMSYEPPRLRKEVLASMRVPLACESSLEDWGNYIVLHAAGGWETKRLPDATWIEVARGIQSTGKRAVFSWGNVQECRRASTLAQQSHALCLPERLNMSALCRLLQKADAVVGADTGVLHLAAAMECTTVMFWGPSASWRSGPFGPRQWHVESNPPCGPCFRRKCGHFVCMDQIRASAILEALHESGAI
ncbi:MAG: lipopolysaccharide heptosyltransferase I [Zetaproteobacteria bacterium]|nr:MAG: lipopolysaccharide heptosyltransferase I [Zetaproteobacteria bacterium]